jgi:radical SAM protein with 4Fe4S-binding SPASM domain
MHPIECSETRWLSNEEYLRKFNRKSAQLRVPLSGSIDLTHRCNLRCVHCYLGDPSHRTQHEEMGTKQIMSILDQVTEAGCLYFLITGGEPLLREDFPEIYRHAKNNGLLVTVFTNVTLITDKILELFKDLPPRLIEISLYGATASTYETITGVPGSYKKCIHGIERLLDSGINVRLKTILMTINSHEFYQIENMAKAYGVKFRFDPAIFPCFNGDKTPLELRVPPEEAIEKDLSDEKRVSDWKKYFERTQGNILSDTLYQCGAGITGFHIDPFGRLKPCLMIHNITYNLAKGSFSKGWDEVISKILDKKAGDAHACYQCEKIHLCGVCPPFFGLENGQEDKRSEYICALGTYRFKKIKNHL